MEKFNNENVYQFSLKRKDNIIKSIEVIVICIAAGIVGAGLYGLL